MSDPTHEAVFLSYASQDAEASKKLCEALRAVGVEVWFDQNELVGGDAWDAKIRKQIAECALFVPIISAATQARREGYFRLEWRIAAQRTHMMSESIAFLLPVVIDATRDAEADVPAEFKAVQWTRLPNGESSEKFCARVKVLLGGEGRDVSPRHPSTAAHNNPSRPGETSLPRKTARPWFIPAIIGVGLVVAAFFALRPRRSPEEIAKLVSTAQSSAADAAAKSSPAAPLTEARKLVTQARAMFDDGDQSNHENFFLAEELLKRAETLDPVDGEVWAAHAQLSGWVYFFTYDRSAARREAMRIQAERAIKLAPASIEAQLAQGVYLAFSGAAVEEGVRMLGQLAERAPENRRVWRAWGAAISGTDIDQAVTIFERGNSVPGGDPEGLALLTGRLFFHGRYAEVEEFIAKSYAVRLVGRAQLMDVQIKLSWRGDLDGAVEAMTRWPTWLRLEDRGGFVASQVWMWRREPDKAIAALDALTHDLLNDSFFIGPKAGLLALAHEMAHRPDVARTEWENARRVADRVAAEDPSNSRVKAWKAIALARLGRTAEAEPILRELEQRHELRSDFWSCGANGALLRIALGHGDEVVAKFDADARSQTVAVRTPSPQAALRLNPVFDPIRETLAFQKWMAAAPAPKPKEAAPSVDVKADDKSVAVLAFADNSPARDSEYFSDGISEELINALGKVPGLKVPARTSSFYFKGKSVPVPEIAKQLGVAYVIEGSVQRAGDKVKIGARLTKAADGFQVWSESFTRDAKDVFAVEEEIAGLIAKQLSLKLGASSAASTASVNPQAFELYVQGRQAWSRRTPEGYQQADAFFARAIDLDPNFARAYVGRADVLDLRAWDDGSIGRWDQRNSDLFKKIRALLERAIALDPDLAEAYASLGTVIFDEWNYRDALTASRRAVQLNPNYATGWFWLGELLWDRGEMDESLAAVRQAIDLDPLSLASLAGYSYCLRDAGRPTEALAYAERAMQLQPDSRRALAAKALALLDLGQTEAAVPLARALLATEDGREWWLTGIVAARAGLRGETDELLAQYRRAGDDRLAAPILALLDRREEFFAVWQKRPMMTNQPWYVWSPQIDALRKEPRFLQVLEQVGLTEAHARAQAWRKAHPPEKPATK